MRREEANFMHLRFVKRKGDVSTSLGNSTPIHIRLCSLKQGKETMHMEYSLNPIHEFVTRQRKYKNVKENLRGHDNPSCFIIRKLLSSFTLLDQISS